MQEHSINKFDLMPCSHDLDCEIMDVINTAINIDLRTESSDPIIDPLKFKETAQELAAIACDVCRQRLLSSAEK